MNIKNEFSDELITAIDEWAESSLESTGLIKKDSREYEMFKEQAIYQLNAIFSSKTIELFLLGKDNRKIEFSDGYAKVNNNCGDVMEFYLKIENSTVTDSSFQTNDSVPAIASCGMVAEMVRGKTIDDIKKYTQKDVLDSIGGLPDESRHCALLAINALNGAMKNYSDSK
jgi:nitrogen fixation protein NifU and related proteins